MKRGDNQLFMLPLSSRAPRQQFTGRPEWNNVTIQINLLYQLHGMIIDETHFITTINDVGNDHINLIKPCVGAI